VFKGFAWRLTVSLLVIVGAIYIVATTQPRLGLDLRGGTQIVYEIDSSDGVQADQDVIDRTVEVLRRRVDAVGMTEPNIQGSGDNRIIVELPGVSDPDEAIDVIGRTAQLGFHPVLDLATADTEPGEGEQVLADDQGELILVGPAALDGDDVGTANPFFDPQTGAWVATIELAGDGSQAWADITGEAACQPYGSPQNRIAIVLDGEVISSPGVATDVPCGVGITGGQTVISGGFDQDSATELALLIRAGALPVPISIVEQGTIGPTLGQAAIDASLAAALIGAGLTMLYMVFYYRLLGLVAAISLLIYGLVTAAVLLWMGATITLPGIAGFVLAIGMAVDANVLIYERAKEEYQGGLGVRDAAEAGFKKAWSAIADSNVTTLIAAGLLFAFASGGVRGFGVTLSVGVLVSMFTALVVTRVLVDLMTRSELAQARPGALGLTVGGGLRQWIADHRPNLIGRRKVLYIVSAVVIAISLLGMYGRGFNVGLEFSGGRLIEYETATAPDIDDLRAELAEAGFPRAVVQVSGQGNVIVRVEELSESEEAAIDDAVESVTGSSERLRDQFVGPSLGTELRNKALIALGIALGVQLLYLAFRFRWTMGLASVAGMLHDVIVLFGVFAWLGKTIDGVFLAALLTVIGYSINDAVVIFDRIREQRRLGGGRSVEEVANTACLQTIPRTINTGLGALFILVALFVLGGDTLADFALALIVGILVGTYSSVFVSTPIYVSLEERFPPREPDEKMDEIKKAARAGRGVR
jgi:SecD/SecF fusion protein